jgi:CheY-like chemotaxis protein
LGGTLTIASTPGLGTEVAMWLPETPHPAQLPPDAQRMHAALPQSGVVLLVDDEEYIRLSTADMLSELGFSVHEAASAEAALLAIDAGLHPDVLITDHLMPGMTGAEFVRALRKLQPNLPVMVISGLEEAEEQYAGLNVLFRMKPLLPDSLLASVQSLIAGNRP